MNDPREFRYGGFDHRRFESWSRKHFHNVDDLGNHYVVGNGESVMRVIKPGRKCPHGMVVLYEPGCHNGLGEPFVYSDHFLPEELAQG